MGIPHPNICKDKPDEHAFGIYFAVGQSCRFVQARPDLSAQVPVGFANDLRTGKQLENCLKVNYQEIIFILRRKTNL